MSNVYPMHSPSVPPQMPACIVLTPEFAEKLRTFNDLCRALHAADIKISAQNVPDNTITIDAGSVVLLSKCFIRELRGMLSRTEGSITRHRTTVRGVDVVWFVPVKEQDR